MVTKVAKEYPEAEVRGRRRCGRRARTSPTWRSPPSRAPSWSASPPALKTKTDKVGFVGGVKGPIIDPFAAGYQAGVKAVNPKATVEMK